MADIKRLRNAGFAGLTNPGGVQDTLAARCLGELQQSMGYVQAQMQALSSTGAEEYDDSGLLDRVGILEGKVSGFQEAFDKLARDLRNAVVDLTPRLALVTALYDDFLGVVFWDYTAGAWADPEYAEVLVWKPGILQVTPFHEQTVTYENGQEVYYEYTSNYERNADDGVDSEDQMVIPNWFLDDIVLVRRVMPLNPPGEGDTAVWMDLNVGGRMWAKV